MPEIAAPEFTLEDRIGALTPRITEVEIEMASPEALSNPRRMTELAREHRRLVELVQTRDALVRARKELNDLQQVVADPVLAELALEEMPRRERDVHSFEARLLQLMIPEPVEDARNAVVELRAGTGGEEAALFAADLLKMYMHYFELKKWKADIVDSNFTSLGGVKELTLTLSGESVYGRMKWESGVHRVQRVPDTEASGRIHTSAATVAVLPEAEEVDIDIDPSELKIDTYRASGAGGQHVNKTESAIRITHLPTGLVVTCQDERSQIKNRAQAMKVLRSRLFQMKLEAEEAKRAAERRSQVRTGDRSEKIRTYNYPQNRVTDHRVPVTIYSLDRILEGQLDLLLDPLHEHFSRLRLESSLAEGGLVA
ncbi:MAG: peptide chain release factor 1 [Calditrichaeota bacterium]|nr:peptide chain release factor 1 [Calditrichota bacterium]